MPWHPQSMVPWLNHTCSSCALVSLWDSELVRMNPGEQCSLVLKSPASGASHWCWGSFIVLHLRGVFVVVLGKGTSFKTEFLCVALEPVLELTL